MDKIGIGQASVVHLRCDIIRGRGEVAHASSEEHGQKEALLDMKTGTDAYGVRAAGGHPSWWSRGLRGAARKLIGGGIGRQWHRSGFFSAPDMRPYLLAR